MLTERATRQLNDIKAQLSSGKVWNSDYEATKFTLSNEIWKQTSLRDLLLDSGDGKPNHTRTQHDDYPGISELYNALPSNLHEVKAASKKYAKARATCPAHVQEAADAYFAFWLPVWEVMAQAKAVIVKGRKPSENPSATPPRTLENTGTCPVCQRNVKLDDRGRIVNHGYEVRYHEFVGGCFGIGHEPTEVSDSGIKAYQTFLQKMQTQREEAVAAWEAGEITKAYDQRKREWVEQDDARFARLAEAKVHELKTEIRYIASDLETLAMRLEDWRPMPLPGVAAGFAK